MTYAGVLTVRGNAVPADRKYIDALRQVGVLQTWGNTGYSNDSTVIKFNVLNANPSQVEVARFLDRVGRERVVSLKLFGRPIPLNSALTA